MSIFGAIAGALSGGGSSIVKGISGALGGTDPFTGINPIKDYTGQTTAEMNLGFAKKQFEYQKWLNQQQMEREDTSYQRKVADMTAAGFNPILAASGSGSPSAALKSASAPQMENTSAGLRDLASQVLGAISMKKDFAQKDAAIRLLNAQDRKTLAEAESIDIENRYLEDRLLNENAGIRLRNEGQAGRNIYQGYQNAIAENQLYVSASTKFAEVEDRLLSVDQRKKNLLSIDADLVLKSDKHLWYQYENNLQDVRSIWAGKLASKVFDLKTYEVVAKALTLTQVEEDVKLYLAAKKELESKYHDPQVVRRKLALQFGSYASIYDHLQDVVSGAGRNAGEFLRDLGIDFHF